jgi:hypothetical protein
VSDGNKFSADGIAVATGAGDFSVTLFSVTVLQEERKIVASAAAIAPVSLHLLKKNRVVMVVKLQLAGKVAFKIKPAIYFSAGLCLARLGGSR